MLINRGRGMDTQTVKQRPCRYTSGAHWAHSASGCVQRRLQEGTWREEKGKLSGQIGFAEGSENISGTGSGVCRGCRERKCNKNALLYWPALGCRAGWRWTGESLRC